MAANFAPVAALLERLHALSQGDTHEQTDKCTCERGSEVLEELLQRHCTGEPGSLSEEAVALRVIEHNGVVPLLQRVQKLRREPDFSPRGDNPEHVQREADLALLLLTVLTDAALQSLAEKGWEVTADVGEEAVEDEAEGAGELMYVQRDSGICTAEPPVEPGDGWANGVFKLLPLLVRPVAMVEEEPSTGRARWHLDVQYHEGRRERGGPVSVVDAFGPGEQPEDAHRQLIVGPWSGLEQETGAQPEAEVALFAEGLDGAAALDSNLGVHLDDWGQATSAALAAFALAGVAGTATRSTPPALRLLLCGLKNGALPHFLLRRLPSVSILVGESNSLVHDCYHRYFCNPQGKSMRAEPMTQVQDWAGFLLEQGVSHSPDVVILDMPGGQEGFVRLAPVDSGDITAHPGLKMDDSAAGLPTGVVEALQRLASAAEKRDQALTILVNALDGLRGGAVARQLSDAFGAASTILLFNEDPSLSESKHKESVSPEERGDTTILASAGQGTLTPVVTYEPSLQVVVAVSLGPSSSASGTSTSAWANFSVTEWANRMDKIGRLVQKGFKLPFRIREFERVPRSALIEEPPSDRQERRDMYRRLPLCGWTSLEANDSDRTQGEEPHPGPVAAATLEGEKGESATQLKRPGDTDRPHRAKKPKTHKPDDHSLDDPFALFGPDPQEVSIALPNFWLRCVENTLAISTAVAPETSLAASGLNDKALYAEVIRSGYIVVPQAQCPMVDRAICSRLYSGMVHLEKERWPASFIFMYDEAWHVVWHMWDFAEALLGRVLDLEVSFAGFKLKKPGSGARKYVGNNFGRPHRDYTPEESLDTAGRPKVFSMWVPLNDIGPSNGCMYVVPRSGDKGGSATESATAALKYPEFDRAKVKPLAPVPAGTLMGWLGDTIHWGSECSQLDAADGNGFASLPRASLAVVFRAREFRNEAPAPPYSREDLATSDVKERARRIKNALEYFTHWYSIPTELQQQMQSFAE